MEAARISALLEPFLERPLAPAQLEQISTYIDLLLRWNGRINLTAVRDPEKIVIRHFGESLFLAHQVIPAPDPYSAPPTADQRPLATVLDIGSGAGFPALPLKIWAPEIRLTMIEANHKKAAFLREVVRAITLTEVNVMTERAEALVGRIPPAELVTFRAVEHFESIVPIAAGLLASSGRLALLIGAGQLTALIRITPQLAWRQPIAIPGSESRVIAISEPST